MGNIDNQEIIEISISETPKKKDGLFEYFSFFMFGIVNVFSYTIIITQAKYFETRLAQTESLSRAIGSTILASTMTGIILGSTLNISGISKYKPREKNISSMVVTLIGFIVVSIIIVLKTSDYIFFLILIPICFIVNTSQPIMMSAVYEDLRIYNSLSFNMFNIGSSISSLIATLISIAMIPINIEEKFSVLIYFLLAILVTIIGLVLYIRIVYSKYYIASYEKIDADSIVIKKSLLLNFKEMFRFFKEKLIDSLSLLICMAVTLFIYPMLILSVISTSTNTQWLKYYDSIVCFFGYALGETLGRYPNIWFQWPKSSSNSMIIFSLSRILLLFFTLLCNRPGKFTQKIAIFKHDFAPFFITLVLGITCSHLLSRTLSTPYLYEKKEDQTTCARMLVFARGVGLIIGALISYITPYI